MRLSIVAGVIVALGVASSRRQPQAGDNDSVDQVLVANVVEVLDGETLKVQIDGEKMTVKLAGVGVRWRGTTSRAQAIAECNQAGSAAYLTKLIDGRPVTLEGNWSTLADGGAIVSWVSVAGESLNEQMVRDGYAWYRWESVESSLLAEASQIALRQEPPELCADLEEVLAAYDAEQTRRISASTGAPRYSANQYGCHSDGRCLDDWDEWCDETEVQYLEIGLACPSTYYMLED